MQNNELTIIIKTFSRKKSLINLLKSLIKNNITEYKILILDDSKVNSKQDIENQFNHLNIKYIVTEFDIGLSRGRNILLNNVETPYFLLCDDDYIFDKRCNLVKALEVLKENEYDILGGRYYNNFGINNFFEFLVTLRHPKRLYNYILKKEIISDYCGKFELKGDVLELKIKKEETKELIVSDIVNNFFIGKTEAVKKIGGWLEELKVGEHEEFFYRAKLNKLKIGFYKNFAIGHYPIRSFSYNKFRKRVECKKDWLKRYGIKELKTSNIGNIK